MANTKQNNNGFTLVELMVVVAVIAVLAAVLVPRYVQYVESSNQSNDLSIATHIVHAASAAMVDPETQIPAGHYVEILWITGDESGPEVTRGSLLIRHNDGYRVSIFNDKKGTDDLDRTSDAVVSLQPFADHVFAALGGEGTEISNYPGWLQITFQDAQSALGNQSNFAIHISSSTGEVAMAAPPVSTGANPNRWVALGLAATPHPDYPITAD